MHDSVDTISFSVTPDEISQWKTLVQNPSHWKKKQFLFYKEHLPYGAHLLASGSVELVQPTESLETKQTTYTLEKTFSAPVLLGVHHCLNGLRYPLSCRVLEDCTVYYIETLILKKLANSKNNLITGLRVKN